MTTNAFIFAWNIHGIESVIPITKYEKWDQNQLMEILREKQTTSMPNPIGQAISMLLLRARFNTQRNYEIYAIDCEDEMDEEFWWKTWDEQPQETAELIRKRGIKLYSDRKDRNNIKIV